MNRSLVNNWGVLLLMLIAPLLSIAQNDRIFVEEGDKIFNFGDYEDAILFYQLAIEENPKNVRAHYMAGTCFLITTSEKKEAVHYLLKAYELDDEVSNDVLFKIADGYRYRYEFDRAINYFNQYINEIQINPRAYEGIDTEALLKRANRRILECENAKEYVLSPVDFKALNLNGIVNSIAEDYAPTLNQDETVLYFTSRREGSTGGFKDTDNKYFEDIWVTEKVNGEWTTPRNLGENINTNQHESNIGLSPDGNTLYIYHTEGDIYYSEKKDGEWAAIESMGKLVNTEYQETSIHQSSNGSYLFFTSARPGGEGDLDIYVLKKNKKGKWGKPENVGGAVNTEYSEEGPFFDVEESTLYFSSKGHDGMGGYDLYKSVWDTLENSWSEPENLGYPINSADDEVYFTIGGESKYPYYSSFKDDSHGYTDLYMIVPKDEVLEEPEPVVEEEPIVQEPVEVVETPAVEAPVITEPIIEVKPEKVFKPVNIHVTAKDNESKQEISPFSIKVFKGGNKQDPIESIGGVSSFKFSLKDTVTVEYIIMVEATGYVFQSKNVVVEPTEVEQSKELVVYLSKQEKYVPKVLRNIYFGFDKHSLRDDSSVELDQLVKMMNTNKTMIIEIAGHTDFKGSEQYNISLSQKRADAVKSYLIKNGVDDNRVVAKGYGEKYPLASNDDEEEGRELNRRTEFVIVSE